ncbi:Alpha-barbatene synthase [Raphanus sativus]|nr:Alpha-barbatene synthase [Raphanus sativus]
MLSSKEEDAVKKNILLIHLLGSLGLAYHFEREIEETLKHAFEKMEDLINGENDLYTISIMFRAFRTYGHNMPSDVFNRFKGNDGKFKECLIDDVKGLLSLYEAVHFRTTTDHILDEALSFSLDHLEPLASGHRESPPHVLKHVQNALHIPQHRKTQVIVATEYISFYEQEEHHDETLLKLAKLNFKFLRLHYIHELKTVVERTRPCKEPPTRHQRKITGELVLGIDDVLRAKILTSKNYVGEVYLSCHLSRRCL